MAALLRHGLARRLGGSALVQRAREAVAEERRRLGSRLMHTNEGAGEDAARQMKRKIEGAKNWRTKWLERLERFERWDAEFTKFINTAFGLYLVYAILSCKDFLDEMEAAKKK